MHVGMIYPGTSGHDDLVAMGERLGIRVHVASTPVPEDSARESALTELGSDQQLELGVGMLRANPVAAVMWACTSCSFLLGMKGMRRQAEFLARAAGVPASSTSLAILAAVEALGVRRVAVASPYPAPLAARFTDLLESAGIRVASQFHWSGRTAEQLGALDPSVIAGWVGRADTDAAEAVVVPETALHTANLVDDLESTHDKPVVTANQATVWQALRLGGDTRAYDTLSALMAR